VPDALLRAIERRGSSRPAAGGPARSTSVAGVPGHQRHARRPTSAARPDERYPGRCRGGAMTDDSRKALDQLEKIAQFMADRELLTQTVTRLVETIYADDSIPPDA